MDLSIITPIYNTSSVFLADYISSIIKLKITFELILINDGSTKLDTIEWWNKVSEYNYSFSILQINKEINSGISVCRNEGISHAQGDYILILDSDDEIIPDAIEKCVQYAKNNNLDVLFSGYENVYESGETIKKICYKKNLDNLALSSTTSRIIKRKIIIDNEILYPDYCYMEDSCFNALLLLFCEKWEYLDIISWKNRNHSNRTCFQNNVFHSMPYNKIPFEKIEYIIKVAEQFECFNKDVVLSNCIAMCSSICFVFSIFTDKKERKKIIKKTREIRKRIKNPYKCAWRYLRKSKDIYSIIPILYVISSELHIENVVGFFIKLLWLRSNN